MDTILSIDLDILFTPYIGIYSNYIKGKESCNKLWNNLNNIFDIRYFTINQNYFNIIKNILTIYNEQVSTIYIGYDHSSILTAIEQEKNNLNKPYSFIIHNIDFHHDIYYDEEQIELLNHFNIANCANWVGFLTQNHFITQYNWYYGIGSEYNEQMLQTKYFQAYPFMTKQLFNQNFKQDLQINILFISISPQWIPIHQYDYIKELLLILPKEKIKFFELPYFNTNEEKSFLSIKKPLSALTCFNFLENCMD